MKTEDRCQKKKGKFRCAYFTNKYSETCQFYRNKLGLYLEHSWDRNKNDKGSLFRAGFGLIEVLQFPDDDRYKLQGLDYRLPQGVFMVIQVWNIDDLFKKFKAAGVSFKQEIVDQEWGHRTFSLIEPNGVVLLFIQDPFDSQS